MNLRLDREVFREAMMSRFHEPENNHVGDDHWVLTLEK
jgi:hypothetical protein